MGLAKYYSDAISDNVKRAIEQKLRKGEWPARLLMDIKISPIADGNTDIIVDEYEAAYRKKIFELYATGAYSMDFFAAKVKKDYGVGLGQRSTW